MGFWSSVGSFVSSAVSTVAKVAVASVVNTVKNLLTGSSEAIGSTSSYSSNASSVAETINISEILTSFSLKVRDQTDVIEEKTLEAVESYFDELQDLVSGKIDNNILRSSVRETKKEVKGILKQYIAQKVSLDNMECIAVLEMKPGQEKTKSMAAFQKKIINEAIEELDRKLTKAIRKNEKILINSINSSMKGRESQLQQTLKSSEDIINEKNLNLKDSDATKADPLLRIYLSQYMSRILGV